MAPNGCYKILYILSIKLVAFKIELIVIDASVTLMP